MFCPNCSEKLTEEKYCKNCNTVVASESSAHDIIEPEKSASPIKTSRNSSLEETDVSIPASSVLLTESEAELFETIPFPKEDAVLETAPKVQEEKAITEPQENVDKAKEDFSEETTVFELPEESLLSDEEKESPALDEQKKTAMQAEEPVKRSIKRTRKSKKTLIAVIVTLVIFSIAAGGIGGYLSATGKLKGLLPFLPNSTESDFHWSNPENAEESAIKTPKDLGEKLKTAEEGI